MTLKEMILAILGSYEPYFIDGRGYYIDIPWLISAFALLLGCWFAFKVVLLLMHFIGGVKSK